jgi:puromycin-sensitive aminopeptidase
MTESEAKYRLPRSVTPSRYDLRIKPDLDGASFAGSQDVVLTVHEPLTEVLLNAKGLHVRGATLHNAEGRNVDVAKIRSDADAERVHVELEETAEPGVWTLHLDFDGELNDRLVGFYRSTYADGEGRWRTIATTHFEATDARRAFPCWDEPDLKAVFSVSLVVPSDLTAISNGPEVARRSLEDGRVEIRFADTMPMSTYLVAFVVGPLALTDVVHVDGVPTRVACRPGQEPLTQFALDASAFSLRFFADYYGIRYPDAKVDHVALPDFAQGAMENLGCITYRETLVLADPSSATQQELLDIAETVAHELAHMWFGDLVTMRWWNGIWLNEAFATFMSYLAVDAWRPDWQIWPTFARVRASALEVDALGTTRPVEYPVRSPDDASGMFDTLTYTKGGAVLRMLEQWLGPERFRDGIRRYLRQHAYGNTETHDLWDALEAETGEPVRRIMDAWIFQPGYPVVRVERDGDVLRFRQHRFGASAHDDSSVWPVPLLVRQISDGRDETRSVLVEAEGLELPMASPDSLIVANAGGASFVRVSYDTDLRRRLVDGAQAELTAAERHDLVDDAWASVVAADAPVGSFLDTVGGFRDEDELPVWQAILTGLAWCDRFVDGEPRERFRDFVRDLLKPAFDRLGWEADGDEPDLRRALRGQLVAALGVLGNDPETQAMAREFEIEARDGDPVDAQLSAAAVEVVAATGGRDDYERFRQAVGAARTPQEEHRYLFALPRFRDAALLDRTLAEALTGQIRPQDAPFVIARATTNRDLGPRAWDFIAEHWNELNERYASSNIISLAAGVRFLTDPETVDGVQSFFQTHDIAQNAIQLRQILERQREYAALRQRGAAELTARFGG